MSSLEDTLIRGLQNLASRCEKSLRGDWQAEGKYYMFPIHTGFGEDPRVLLRATVRQLKTLIDENERLKEQLNRGNCEIEE